MATMFRVESILADEKEVDETIVGTMKHFLVSTLEVLRLPENVIANIWIRSSYARRGVIGSFGTIDAGYHGSLTLSFFNAGPDLHISRGDRIAQVIFLEMKEKSSMSYEMRSGHYQHSRGVVKGEDKDI